MSSELILTIAVYLGIALAAFGLAFWAYRARIDRSAFVGLYLLFGIPSLLLLIAGAATVLVDLRLGVVLLVVGLGLGLPLLRPVRRLFALFTPLDPASPVDMTGLCLLLALLGILGLSLIVQSASGSDSTKSPATSVSSVSEAELVAQVAFEVIVAYAAVGFWYVRDFRAASARLGLRRLPWRAIGIAVGCVVVGWVISAVGSVLTAVFQPHVSAQINQVTQTLTADVQNPLGAIVLGVSAGVGEELLFRGALQPRFGIWLTSLAFALLHTQYGFSFVVVGLFGIGLLLGWERMRYGTWAAIITHAIFDIAAVLAQTYS